MTTSRQFPSRRTALALGAGAAVAAVAPTAGTARAATGTPPHGDALTREFLTREFRALEQEHDARLGVYARNTVTGREIRHRADELFPICSVHKTITAAAVLRDRDRHGEFLARRIRYTAQDVTDSGYGPVTGEAGNLADGMTVAELCAAALAYSDNAADNLLLRELGGPTAVTRFCRSVGDRTTRLDRWEPELNSAEPDRVTDTTSPAAIGRTTAALLLGDALAPHDRRRLTDWMLANTTSGPRFRLGLPADWTLADKTGTGRYGTGNDVGVAWTGDGTPVVLSVLTTRSAPDAAADSPLIARTAELLAAALG